MALSKRLHPNDAESVDRKPALQTTGLAASGTTVSTVNGHVRRLRKRASPTQKAAEESTRIATAAGAGQGELGGATEDPTLFDRNRLCFQFLRHHCPNCPCRSSTPSGFGVLYLYTHNGDPATIYRWLSLFFAIVVGADLLRFSYRPFNRLYIRLLGPLMRNHEVEAKFNGVAYYVAGCIIALALFPKDIASLSIVYLSWCDPTASICGRLWGRYTPRFNNKSLAGSLGAAVAGVLVTYGFFTYMIANGFDHPSWSPDAPAPLALVALYGGSVAAFAEGVDLFGWDDNLTIPVLSAVMMWGVLVLGGLGVAA
ncbi:hypothetical protein BC937DRAFT_91075 [Endogone sp. FLAS-F59071]|nr:hypothetical protein BC937DRAFT_91075 [Endogone sp. FLAS-F59071]|eukprot:RUS16559.1 hypothetical protein BC937DRAFT_91075 [Endogone sp. FLAS-F59071]